MKFWDIQGKRIFVAGHRGMVGNAIVRILADEPCEILTADRNSLDLRDQAATSVWIHETKPDAIIVAAAKVGGIVANEKFPAEFIYDNIMIAANIVDAAHRANVERLLLLGSSSVYPKHAKQPLVEDALLTGLLEPTHEWYAVAKIAGLKLTAAYRRQYGRNYIAAMPTNLYGPGDNFDLQTSHVLPAMIRKVHEAKSSNAPSVDIWGTGSPLREFLHVEDCASACATLLKTYFGEQHINIGSGEEISILGLAELISDVIGYKGQIALDRDKPDGAPKKLMSSDKLRGLGWKPAVDLRTGIATTYTWFLENMNLSNSDARDLTNPSIC